MTATTVGPLPPHGVIDGFLPDAERRALLDWVMSQRAAFKPAKVFAGEGGRHEHEDPRLRIALKLYGIGPFDALVREHLLANLPQILAFAGYNRPDPRSIEFELNAYGDGAHFGPHIDIPVGAGRRTVGEEDGEDRM